MPSKHNPWKLAIGAGFLAADGNVFRKDSHQKLSVELSKKDEKHLLKLLSFLQLEETRLKFRVRGQYSYSRIQLNSRHLLDDLELFGVVANKTKTLQFPKLTDERLDAYLCGYIDGDGCIGCDLTRGKYVTTRLTITSASEAFTKALNLYLVQITNRPIGHNYVYKHMNTFNVILSGSYADKVLDRLKGLPVPKLSRKWK